jgi:hypothetical protein
MPWLIRKIPGLPKRRGSLKYLPSYMESRQFDDAQNRYHLIAKEEPDKIAHDQSKERPDVRCDC